MDSFNERLKEERQRLGLNQDEFGELGGVKRNAQKNYENGSRNPDIAYLGALSQHGVDINYVVTGFRTITEKNQREEFDLMMTAYRLIEKETQKTNATDEQKANAAFALYQAYKEKIAEPEQLAKIISKAIAA